MRSNILLLLVTLIIVSCDPGETPIDAGNVSFIVKESGLGAGRVATLTPDSVIVSIEDLDGKPVFESTTLALTKKGDDFETEPLMLPIGKYNLTKYLVVSGDKVTYATPRTGAEKATLIDLPLPMEFNVDGKGSTTVTPKIVGISSHDVPARFGYTDFDYGDTTIDEYMTVRVKFELTVGRIFYKFADAEFIVKGLDANNNPVYSQVFQYTGPQPNDIRIKTGYPLYTIEAKAWTWSSTQTFTEAELYQWRVRPGVVPLTRVYSYTTEPRKIRSTITSFERSVNGVRNMVPESKTVYNYNGSKLSSIDSYTYAGTEAQFTLSSRREFVYQGDRLSKILTTPAGSQTPSTEDIYIYNADGRASHIQNTSFAAGVTTDVDITYGAQDRVVRASYRMSNGSGFEYEFDGNGGNIQSDKTMRGSQLCSAGAYTYDKNINPLKHLGYIDFLFRNYSSSNRLSEDIAYTGCAFPSLVPETYSYSYDIHGYPALATTIYKGSGLKSQVEYTYQD